jgi:phage N-6-adenine-methyltransferase
MKKGKQDHVTPMELIQAVNIYWPLFFDLAATKANRRCERYYGVRGDGVLQDSLKEDWARLCIGNDKYLWLNPGFSGTGTWMKKCLEEMKKGARIVTLTLADTGTRWYENYVQGNALALVLRDRVTFEGQKNPHIKECMVSVWNNRITGEGHWRWKREVNQ